MMLKKISLLVLVSVFLASGVFGQVVYESACESLDGWQIRRGTVTLSPDGRTGNCFKMEMPVGARHRKTAIEHFTKLEPFAQYEISVWAKGDTVINLTYWQFDLFGKYYASGGRIDTRDLWIQKKVTFRATVKGRCLYFWLQMCRPGTVYIDDISLTKIEDASVYLAKQDATTDKGKRILGQAQYFNEGKITILKSIETLIYREIMFLANCKKDEVFDISNLTSDSAVLKNKLSLLAEVDSYCNWALKIVVGNKNVKNVKNVKRETDIRQMQESLKMEYKNVEDRLKELTPVK